MVEVQAFTAEGRARTERKSAPMSARRGPSALVFVSLSLCASGCGLESCSQEFFNPTGKGTGARLTAPKSAKAGDTITLDATGSEIDTTVGESRLCPDIVRFYLGPPGTFSNKKVDPEPIKVIGRPQTNPVREGGVFHCRLVEGKVRVKVPSAPQAGVSDFEVAVGVQGDTNVDPDAGGGDALFIAVASGTISVDTPAGPGPGPGPANKPPVAKFFALTDPSVQGRAIDLDARESFDPDGTITGYDFDFDGDGTFDLSSNDPVAVIPDAGSPGNRRIVVRVHDDKGATAESALDQLVVAPTTFTEGTFASPTEAAVNTPFDLAVDNNVTGADTISLDADNDGQFDDGLPNATAAPGDAQPQFSGMQYATGGWKRLAVLWHDNTAPNEETITTHLIKVTPFVNPSSRRGAPRATAAKAGTRLSARLTPLAVTPVTVRSVKLVRVGILVHGLVIRGRLRGRLSARRLGRKVPPGAKVLTNAVFAGSLDGTVPMRPDGTYGTPTGGGLLLARARSDRGTMVCLRVTQPSATRTRFTVLGATGKARGLRASGGFPALRLDPLSRRTRSTRVAITVRTGTPKGLSRQCRALTRQLAAPR